MKLISSKNFNTFLDINIPTVILHAHSDDESFLTAGTIQEINQTSQNLVLVYFATSLVPGEIKTKIRQEELKKAAKILNVKSVIFLDFCEPKYDSNKSKPLVLQTEKDILDNMYKKVPEILKYGKFNLISYDKNGGYGNKDHVIVHKIGRKLFNKHKNKISKFYEATIDRDLYKKWLILNRDKLNNNLLPKLQYWSKNFGLNKSEISHSFLLTDIQVQNKKKALNKHISQMTNKEFPLGLDDKNFKLLFGTEKYKKIK